MARPVPEDFDFKSIKLDSIETAVRDDLNIDIENWAKFRFTITASASSKTLKSKSPISLEVKTSFVELSKSHYETVTTLGAVKLSLKKVLSIGNKDDIEYRKSFKEFYMHAGSVLDNLARLIYIINAPDSPTAKNRYDERLRHSIGYGSLPNLYRKSPDSFKGYHRLINLSSMHEIKTIRNNFAHSWPPVFFIKEKTLELYWPSAMRKREQYYYWPHDPEEKKMVNTKFKKKVPIAEMINDDWKSLETFQSNVFKKLVVDVKRFEKNHNLKIWG